MIPVKPPRCQAVYIITYGHKNYGAEVVATALEQLEFDMAETNKAISIGTLSLAFRKKNPLTSEHYYILAAIDDVGRRTEWAQTAVKEKLNAFELKRSIEKGSVIRLSDIQKLSGQGSGITTVQGVVFQFQQWERKIGGREAALQLPESERRTLLSHLTQIVELAAALEVSLH